MPGAQRKKAHHDYGAVVMNRATLALDPSVQRAIHALHHAEISIGRSIRQRMPC